MVVDYKLVTAHNMLIGALRAHYLTAADTSRHATRDGFARDLLAILRRAARSYTKPAMAFFINKSCATKPFATLNEDKSDSDDNTLTATLAHHSGCCNGKIEAFGVKTECDNETNVRRAQGGVDNLANELASAGDA